MKSFLIIVLAIAIGHCTWTIMTPKVNHYFLDSKIRDMAAQGRLYNQHEMLKEIMRVVDEKHIPVDAKQIRFKRDKDGRRMKISVEYEQTVSVPFYTRTYEFESEYSGVYDPKR